jgi:hypothetical protein
MNQEACVLCDRSNVYKRMYVATLEAPVAPPA